MKTSLTDCVLSHFTSAAPQKSDRDPWGHDNLPKRAGPCTQNPEPPPPHSGGWEGEWAAAEGLFPCPLINLVYRTFCGSLLRLFVD